MVFLYMYIVRKGIHIAQHTTDPFAKYLAIGIVSWVLVQSFVNIGVNLNIVPLTGVTLPFVSYGGSSLMSLMIAMGIILNISRYTHENHELGVKKKNTTIII